MTISPQDYLQQFPKLISAERPVPADMWPDMPGVRTAEVVTWEPTLKKWREFCKVAKNFPLVSFDTETSGLRPFHGSRIVGVSLSIYDGKEIQAGYWNMRHVGHPAHSWCRKHDEATKPATRRACEKCQRGTCSGYKEDAPVIPLFEVKNGLESIFERCITGGQNLKYDAKMCHIDGIKPPHRVLDTMLIAHLWDEMAKGYSLEKLAVEMGEEKLGDTIKEYLDEHGLEVEGHGHEQVPHEVELPYAIRDTVLVLKRLQFERERWEASADPKLMEVFQIENAQSPIFASMECNGMKLDVDYISKGVEQFEREMRELEVKIYREAGKEFNILSLDQLWEVLANRGLKARSTSLLSSTSLRESMRGERQRSGKPSLNDFDLTYYGEQGDKLCPLVKEYRVRSKMCGTYFKPFLEEHRDRDGFLHADFMIHGTTTGRASCREPNLQNLTKLEKFGARAATGSIAKAIHQKIADKDATDDQHHLEVRRCFVPRGPDYSLFFFDFNQMEMRVFTDYTDEEFMMRAIEEGMDIHAAVAQKVFPNFPKKEDDPKMYSYFRTLAKQISFGLIYGMGVNKLSRQLDVAVDEPVRLVKLVLAAAEDGFDVSKAATMTVEECNEFLKDHEVMTASRLWSGLKSLGKEVMYKVNPGPLEEFLFRTKERKDKYNNLLYSAREFLTQYHQQFPKIKQFSKGIETTIAKRGYIFNKFGRRYHILPDEAYIGINRLVQGSSADMVKVTQWRVNRLLQGKKSKLLNQVHDELQVDVHHSELDVVEKVRECMQYFPNLKVKMRVDVDYSHISWADKKPWKDVKEFEESLAALRESTVKEETTKKSPAKKSQVKKPRTKVSA